MSTARFPGQKCCVCGGEFVPRQTEIEAHPNMRGPRGGKQYMHSNPHECGGARSNPFASMNAGRRKKRGRQYPMPDFVPPAGQMAAYHPADVLGLSVRELQRLESAGESFAPKELSRRQRNSSGEKINTPEWLKQYRAKKKGQAAANPRQSKLPKHLRLFEF